MYIFDGNHCEVVTLFGAADELMYSIGHFLKLSQEMQLSLARFPALSAP